MIIQGLYYIGVLKNFQESVLVIVISVSVIGAILTYIYPRRIVTKHFKVEFTNTKLQVLDLFTHQLPLIVFLLVYDPKIKPDNLLFAATVLLTYVVIYNPVNVYNFKCDKSLPYNNLNKNNKLFTNNVYRYHVATGALLLYFIILILAVYSGIFR